MSCGYLKARGERQEESVIEIPEGAVLAEQLGQVAVGRRIERVVAAHSPHKLASFNGDPSRYDSLLAGRTIGRAAAFGSFVELVAGDARLVFSEGVSLRFHAPSEDRPAKHQLLVELDGGSAISASVQMYGALYALRGELDNRYYQVARTRPSPLGEEFDLAYFSALLAGERPTLSAKALLATEQRIPGLGNGVLQDILFRARIHPKRKLATLAADDRARLFSELTQTLRAMRERGGRDTERDLFGAPGGYRTLMSSRSCASPCPACGGAITKEAYLGGSVYFCTRCQPLDR